MQHHQYRRTRAAMPACHRSIPQHQQYQAKSRRQLTISATFFRRHSNGVQQFGQHDFALLSSTDDIFLAEHCRLRKASSSPESAAAIFMQRQFDVMARRSAKCRFSRHREKSSPSGIRRSRVNCRSRSAGRRWSSGQYTSATMPRPLDDKRSIYRAACLCRVPYPRMYFIVD